MRQMFAMEVMLRAVLVSRYPCRDIAVVAQDGEPEARVGEAVGVPPHKAQVRSRGSTSSETTLLFRDRRNRAGRRKQGTRFT